MHVRFGGGPREKEREPPRQRPTQQLTTLTRGAGTPDALTTTFGYSGTQLISVTTPYTQATRTWTPSYDDAGRLVSLSSPVSGTLGQAGSTPAYTTLISYSGGTTQVVDGAGTSGALTTTDMLDGAGEATQVTDGLGNTSSATYDADHDVLSSTDANGNVTTNAYQYVGPDEFLPVHGSQRQHTGGVPAQSQVAWRQTATVSASSCTNGSRLARRPERWGALSCGPAPRQREARRPPPGA